MRLGRGRVREWWFGSKRVRGECDAGASGRNPQTWEGKGEVGDRRGERAARRESGALRGRSGQRWEGEASAELAAAG